MGQPKALIRHDDGTPWVVRARQALLDGGCEDVVTVLGAQAEDAGALIADTRFVVAPDWQHGISASLAAGLNAIGRAETEAVMIHLVDLPDVGAAVIQRMAAYAGPSQLARAVYRNNPGHPVVIGRDHWEALTRTLAGDQGARGYLAHRHVALVECGDLAAGDDVDTRPHADGSTLDI